MKIRRFIFISILLIIIASIIAYFIYVPNLKERTVQKLENYIEKNFIVDVEISKVTGGLWKGISVESVRITKKGDPTYHILSANKINAKFRLFGIFKKENFISGITLEYPSLTLKRDYKGSINITELFPLREKKKKTVIPISYILIKDGKIDFVDEYKREKPFNTGIFIESAKLNFGEDNEIIIRNSYCLYKRTLINLRGSINFKDKLKTDVELKANPLYLDDNFSLISSYFPEFSNYIPPISGKGVLELSASVSKEEIKVNGNLNLNEGNISGEPIRRVKANFNFVGNSFESKDISILLRNKGMLNASVFFPFTPDLSFNLNLRLKEFPAICVLSFIPFIKNAVQGRINGKFNLSGFPKNYESFSGESSLQVYNGSIVNPKEIKAEPIEFDRIETETTFSRGFINVKKGKLVSKDFDIYMDGKISFNKELDLNGKAVIEKGKVLKGFFRKLIAPLLPDSEKGFRFKFKLTGDVTSPKIKYSIPKTVIEGLQDNIRDTSNKIEKIFKRIF